MTVRSVVVNGEKLNPVIDDRFMTIRSEDLLKDINQVDIEVTLEPEKNLSLSGLYKSSGNFCTQCEAEGFRNFMYFMDRPDNMSMYSTKIIAHKSAYPVLLSNGNEVEKGDLDNGMHYSVWEDPWPKPSYLFALVAGNLVSNKDFFQTRSGKKVELGIYVETGNLDKTTHAMESIKRAFKWDEERFDREYDLDQFNVVAVNDFNMGAMENKGLNIFNSKYVLASPETATDEDYLAIEAIIGHEYFHNWSGNRVTCRDWFQLTLKEGLTVFRDQEFTSDLHDRGEKRIDDVRLLRRIQFSEDNGPMKHPIRPDSYIAMDNFYTSTVYEKGAEVIRMIYTLVGTEGFKRGLNRYFETHDGHAVTCEDFLASMEVENPQVDLSQFLTSWYSQSGTPELVVTHTYNEETKCFHVHVKNDREFDVPIVIGLVGVDDDMSRTLRVRTKEENFTFENVPSKPVPSYLRGFSAPVILRCLDMSRDDLAFLSNHDTDAFNRYDALQQLVTQLLLDKVHNRNVTAHDEQLVLEAIKNNLTAQSLTFPDEQMLTDMLPNGTVKAESVIYACDYLDNLVASNLESVLERTYLESSRTDSPKARALKNRCLWFLALRKRTDLALEQITNSGSMTDKMGGLAAINRVPDCSEREAALEYFLSAHRGDPLVVQKWLRLEASATNALPRVMKISESDLFDIKNPNETRALFGTLAANFREIHSSHEPREFLLSKIVEIDSFNPQLAAKLAKQFGDFRKYTHAAKIEDQIQDVHSKGNFSPDLSEVFEMLLLKSSSKL